MIKNADGSVTYRLKKIIKLGEEEFAELVIREPVAKDLRKLPMQPGTGDLLDMAARLCGHPPSVIDQMGMIDTQAVLGIVSDFIQPGPAIGETGSEL